MDIQHHKYHEEYPRLNGGLDQVDPESLYIMSSFSGVTMENGDPVNVLIVQGKKDGDIPYVIDGSRHIIKGSDVLAYLNGELKRVAGEREVVRAFYASETAGKTVEGLIEMLVDKDIELNQLREDRRELKRCKREINSLRSSLDAVEGYVNEARKSEGRWYKQIEDCVSKYIFDDQYLQVTEIKSLTVCGVYFLFWENKLQYIGQSVNIFGRVGQHQADKKFDEVRYFTCPRDELDDREMFLIRLLKPPLNGQYKKAHYSTVKIIKNLLPEEEVSEQ